MTDKEPGMAFGTTNMTDTPLITPFGTINIADSPKIGLGSLHC